MSTKQLIFMQIIYKTLAFSKDEFSYLFIWSTAHFALCAKPSNQIASKASAICSTFLRTQAYSPADCSETFTAVPVWIWTDLPTETGQIQLIPLKPYLVHFVLLNTPKAYCYHVLFYQRGNRSNRIVENGWLLFCFAYTAAKISKVWPVANISQYKFRLSSVVPLSSK